jgi:MscS family membrane protein
MQEFFEQTFYYNTVQQWAYALAIAVGVWLLSKMLYWISSNILRKAVEKTKTKLDDILLDTLEQPLILLFTLVGFLVAYHRLEFPEQIDTWMNRAYHAAVTVSVTWLIARTVDALIREYLVPYAERTDSKLDDHLLPMVRKGLRSAIWILGIIVALNNAGYNVGALLAGIGIGGLALAMAAKDTLANVFGGIAVLVDKPFIAGDRIRIGGFDGTVMEVGIRSTRIRTLEGPTLVIPNHKFTDSLVENVTAEPARRIRHEIGVTYDTPPEQMERALAILNGIVDEFQDALEERRLISFNSFGAFSLNMLFIAYIRKEADIFATQTRVSMAILQRFNAAGLNFAFPTQTLHLANGTALPEKAGAE